MYFFLSLSLSLSLLLLSHCEKNYQFHWTPVLSSYNWLLRTISKFIHLKFFMSLLTTVRIFSLTNLNHHNDDHKMISFRFFVLFSGMCNWNRCWEWNCNS
jgi:hypothetical protein